MRLLRFLFTGIPLVFLLIFPWPASAVHLTDSPVIVVPNLRLCGNLGNKCCRPPIGGSDSSFGPLVSCDVGLGCDITTDRCVSPCGGEGQVCCDGPETRALKWTDTGKVFSPDPSSGFFDGGVVRQLIELCKSGACDKPSHRCIPCGTTPGAACCPPDAAQATARCVAPHQECKFDDQSATSGVCLECGNQGKPPCTDGCDFGLDVRNGLCDICGADGQPPCDNGCQKGLGLVGRVMSILRPESADSLRGMQCQWVRQVLQISIQNYKGVM